MNCPHWCCYCQDQVLLYPVSFTDIFGWFVLSRVHAFISVMCISVECCGRGHLASLTAGSYFSICRGIYGKSPHCFVFVALLILLHGPEVKVRQLFLAFTDHVRPCPSWVAPLHPFYASWHSLEWHELCEALGDYMLVQGAVHVTTCWVKLRQKSLLQGCECFADP